MHFPGFFRIREGLGSLGVVFQHLALKDRLPGLETAPRWQRPHQPSRETQDNMRSRTWTSPIPKLRRQPRPLIRCYAFRRVRFRPEETFARVCAHCTCRVRFASGRVQANRHVRQDLGLSPQLFSRNVPVPYGSIPLFGDAHQFRPLARWTRDLYSLNGASEGCRSSENRQGLWRRSHAPVQRRGNCRSDLWRG
jgi:hypothetical protein